MGLPLSPGLSAPTPVEERVKPNPEESQDMKTLQKELEQSAKMLKREEGHLEVHSV